MINKAVLHKTDQVLHLTIHCLSKNSEPQFRSERLRNRAVRHGREEVQKPMSSRMAQQQHRTIKTRRTIISSEEDDQAAIHQEEIVQQRRRKIKAKSKKIMIEQEDEQDDLEEIAEHVDNGRKNRSSHKRRTKEESKSEASHNRASSSSSVCFIYIFLNFYSIFRGISKPVIPVGCEWSIVAVSHMFLNLAIWWSISNKGIKLTWMNWQRRAYMFRQNSESSKLFLILFK